MGTAVPLANLRVAVEACGDKPLTRPSPPPLPWVLSEGVSSHLATGRLAAHRPRDACSFDSPCHALGAKLRWPTGVPWGTVAKESGQHAVSHAAGKCTCPLLTFALFPRSPSSPAHPSASAQHAPALVH